jgi:quinol monooxygenase YgiN
MAITYFVRMTAKPGRADEVRELLLMNPRRIEAGEPGNLAFAVHRGRDDPNEFWLYETWESEEAVNQHESGEAFLSYKEAFCGRSSNPTASYLETRCPSRCWGTRSTRRRPRRNRVERAHCVD